MFIAAGILAAVLVILYLYFLLNKAVEEPKNYKISNKEPKEKEDRFR
jgi:hypothetical protein